MIRKPEPITVRLFVALAESELGVSTACSAGSASCEVAISGRNTRIGLIANPLSSPSPLFRTIRLGRYAPSLMAGPVTSNDRGEWCPERAQRVEGHQPRSWQAIRLSRCAPSLMAGPVSADRGEWCPERAIVSKQVEGHQPSLPFGLPLSFGELRLGKPARSRSLSRPCNLPSPRGASFRQPAAG